MRDIVLPGSSDISGKISKCDKCGREKPREGGIEPRPGQFVCRHCWRFSAIRKRSVDLQNS